MAEPAWSIATLFPPQGSWSEQEYLSFSAERAGLELRLGHVDVLPMATDRHQSVLDALFLVLIAYARQQGGRARTAGIRVRVATGVFRQPDIVYLSAENLHLRANDFWRGADLVVEVISASAEDRTRDLVTKRAEYAAAGIREYWIADPDAETIRVFTLANGTYPDAADLGRGSTLRSPAFPGLEVDVSAIFDAD